MRGRAEHAERHPVVDAVCDQRAVRVLLERVRVLPAGERAAQLHVDEAPRRLPALDPRAPRDGHAVQRQAVVDQRTLPDLKRLLRQDPEAEPGRRDRLQVGRVGEERERLVDAERDELLALDQPVGGRVAGQLR